MAKTGAPKVFRTAFESYTVVSQEREGGTARLYKVRDEENAEWALKCLKPDVLNKQRAKRFKNELLFCFHSSHPNVVRVTDFGCIPVGDVTCPFYVMPWYPKTLRDVVQVRLDGEAILRCFAQMLDGVEAAHLAKVIHRDLKPENVLLDDKMGTVVVADFGIAHFPREDQSTSVATRPQERLANFAYAAPEQGPGGTVDHRADIYALGLMLNEMFTGSRPEGSRIKKIADGAPDFSYLDDLVDLMRSQSPDDRPPSIAAVKDQLIAREVDFVRQQHLSKLKGTVIPDDEVDDPLVADRPQIVPPFDYQGGKWIFILNQPVTPEWVYVFRNVNYQQFPTGMGPEDYSFDRAQVVWDGPMDFGQRAVNHLKKYLELAAPAYRDWAVAKKRTEEEQRGEALRRQIGEEDARVQALGAIRL